jgi:ABC-type multidrug transport system fused ATPase/permease subunit
VLLDRRLFSGFLFAAMLHALGHGAMAVVAGLLGRSLAGGGRLTLSAWGTPFGQTTLALVGLLGACAKAAGATVGATLQSQLAQNVAIDLRRVLAQDLLAEGSRLSAGQLSARVSVALREVELGVQEGFLAALRAALQLLPLVVALLWLSSAGAFVVVLVVAPFAVLMNMGRRRWKARYREGVVVAEALHCELDELVAHMDVWRTYGAGTRVCQALDQLGARARHAAGGAEGGRAFLSSANEVLAAGALLIGLFVAEHAGTSGAADGGLVALAAVVFMSYRPLRELSDARTALDRGALAFESLQAVACAPRQELRDDASRSLQTGIQTGPDGDAHPLASWPARALEVNGLSVRRAEETERADRARISFSARFGEIIAIAGPTGSGKTTLLRALLGLENSVGSLCYGDRDLSRASVGPRARPFAWVPQDAPMLAGTLQDNLLLDATHADEANLATAKLAAALELLGAAELAERLGQARLGATGRPVSGGERKWIALARALATELPVLLLDEPTAGLDAEAERRVLSALAGLRGTRTIVLVSHQPEPLAIADRVIRMPARLSSGDASVVRGAPSALFVQN